MKYIPRSHKTFKIRTKLCRKLLHSQKKKIKNKITQLMNDSLLLTISIKKANIPHHKIKIIRSLFLISIGDQSRVII